MRSVLALLLTTIAVASCEADLPTARDLVFACTADVECGAGVPCQDGVCGGVGGPSSDAGRVGADAGVVVVVVVDGGAGADGGSAVDAGRADAGLDAGDIGDVDAGSLDAGVVDAGVVDAGPTDAGVVPGDWWDVAFSKRRRIDVVTNKVTGGPHGSFVALVQLDADAALAAFARDDGRDVAFVNVDGANQLAHELRSFDGATGELVAWVRISSVSSAGTSLWMYFGAPGASAQEDPDATWGEEHAGVWHLDDVAAPVDSSAHGNDGSPINLDATNGVDGIVGGAVSFEGEGAQQSIDCGNDASLDQASPLTTSAWVSLTDAQYDHFTRVLNKKDGWDACCGYDMEAHPLRNRVATVTGGSSALVVEGSITWAPDAWHHYAVVHDGALVRIYVDGQKVGERTDAAPIQTGGGASLQIGSIGTRAYDFFNGRIDEVRVISAARGPGRLATEYENQRAPASFFTVGALESL